MSERWWMLVLLAVIVAFGAVPRPAIASRPAMRPAADAEPWMVDALPGIGPQRLPAALADVRAGRFDRLPTAAQAPARAAFSAAAAPAR